jgi:GTP cyclohydrolase FolE2
MRSTCMEVPALLILHRHGSEKVKSNLWMAWVPYIKPSNLGTEEDITVIGKSKKLLKQPFLRNSQFEFVVEVGAEYVVLTCCPASHQIGNFASESRAYLTMIRCAI